MGAINATLSIMVGGDRAAFNEVMPIFEKLGKTITLCGPNGAGQTVKACNQIQVALNFVGVAEALVLGAKAGVDQAIIVKVLSGGYAQTRVMVVFAFCSEIRYNSNRVLDHYIHKIRRETDGDYR